MAMLTSNVKIDHPRVVAAIHAAEQQTSGQIRVVVARHKAAEPLAAATKHFERLGMTHTAARNGVLIFVAPRSRSFAVIGDTAVHGKCGEAFWRELANAMTGYFRQGDFTGGIVHGIERAGALLAEHFPHQPGAKNELSDEVDEV